MGGIELTRARAVHPRLEVVASIDSTNAELARREAVSPQPPLTALVALEQTAGRGRLDRRWSAPAGASVAISVVIRSAAPLERRGLVTLLGGLAARTAVAAELPGAPVALKWPNDVLVGDRKIVGVLAQLVPETGAIVLGAGINTAMTAAELPVPTATSIAIERGDAESRDPIELADAVVAGYLGALAGLLARFEAADGDLERAGLHAELEAACSTIGARVRIELPDGTASTGRAVGIGPDGALLVVGADGGAPTPVLVGDITHLRML